MKIEKLDKNNEELWNKFVKENQESKIQYALEWKKVIEKTYKNCKPHYYLISEQNKVKAIWPFFLIKSKFFGNRLISQPFLDFGGPIGDINDVIIKNIIEEKKKIKIKYIEIRLNTFSNNYNKNEKILLNNDFEKELKIHQFILELKNEKELWNKFHKHTRNDIRKAEKSDLELKEIKDKEELKKFYKLYLKSMKNFGSPQHPRKFFENLWEFLYPNMIKGINCYYKNKLIGSIIAYLFKDYIYIIYNVSDPKYRIYKPNDILYWTLIKWAIKNKYKYFDFGQVQIDAEKESHAYGLFKFKSKWLGKLYERPYFYYPEIKTKEEKKGRKDKYKKFIKIWKKLPLFIIKIIGPKICSQLGL